jgi:hypothetical protein
MTTLQNRHPDQDFLILVFLLAISGVSLLATISALVAEIYVQ